MTELTLHELALCRAIAWDLFQLFLLLGNLIGLWVLIYLHLKKKEKPSD